MYFRVRISLDSVLMLTLLLVNLLHTACNEVMKNVCRYFNLYKPLHCLRWLCNNGQFSSGKISSPRVNWCLVGGQYHWSVLLWLEWLKKLTTKYPRFHTGAVETMVDTNKVTRKRCSQKILQELEFRIDDTWISYGWRRVDDSSKHSQPQPKRMWPISQQSTAAPL